MQAIILVGGAGRRLGNIVKNTPKPLLEVNKEPFVVKIVQRLIDQGVKKIIFCLGYKAKKIINFFGNGSKWKVKISYVVEKKPKGTAGAIRGAYTKISDPNVIVLNGDSFCHFDSNNCITYCIMMLALGLFLQV
jgi:NDP-sugar pyrophosphorylase family protein